MKKRLAILLLISVFYSSAAYSQTSEGPDCELEQLAIDAALGKTIAQYDLGVHFYTGKLVAKDWSKAAFLWQQAAYGRDIRAYNNLGYLNYTGGNGFEANPTEGIRLWRLAAEKGFAESQRFLGKAYSDGKVLRVDLIEAFAWTETGIYSARQMDDNNVTKIPILEDAEKQLDDLRSRMTDAQIDSGRTKAKKYISRHGAIKTN